MLYIDKIKKIQNEIIQISANANLVIVTKNQDLNIINNLVKAGYSHFGENRIQESLKKWTEIVSFNTNVNLHLIGPIQSNKAKDAHKIFNYIHSLENEKIAKIFSELETKSHKKIKYFIQVNVGNEPQKNGISIEKTPQLVKYCMNDLKLNIVGLMCIPPAQGDPTRYFISLAELAKQNNLKELSMGMSNDYECAIKNGATFVRIGSKIFSGN